MAKALAPAVVLGSPIAASAVTDVAEAASAPAFLGAGVVPPGLSTEDKADIRRGFALLGGGSASVENLAEAERIFTSAIDRWQAEGRPSGDIAQVLLGRGKVRVERNELAGGTLRPVLETAVQDFTKAIAGMRADARVAPVRPDGTAEYQEFPDAYVRRGLANEGLGRWEEALQDYSTAIGLWGGEQNDFRRGDFSDGGRLGVNPYVLNFRGNALSRLGRYEEAASDYRTAGAQFGAVQDRDGFKTSLSNEALAMYGAGYQEESERLMRRVLRREPETTDMRAALAASYWGRGERDLAESEWQLACDRTPEGCAKYKDGAWVQGVRRWPPELAEALARFLRREVPLVALPATAVVAR